MEGILEWIDGWFVWTVLSGVDMFDLVFRVNVQIRARKYGTDVSFCIMVVWKQSGDRDIGSIYKLGKVSEGFGMLG